MRAIMKELGMDSYEIESKITELKVLKGWIPITLKELIEMSDKDLRKLMSYCWHDGDYRCDTIGISNLKTEKLVDGRYNVEWSDSNGDPSLYAISLNGKINNVGDGAWNYGLFKKL